MVWGLQVERNTHGMVHLSCYTNSCIVHRLFPEGAGQKMPHCQDERRTSTGTGIGAGGFFHQLVPSLGLQDTTAAVSTAASLCNGHANVHIHPDQRHLASLMQVSDTPTLPETAPDLLPSPAPDHNPETLRYGSGSSHSPGWSLGFRSTALQQVNEFWLIQIKTYLVTQLNYMPIPA